MASREKARRFLEESEAHKHYSSIVECTLTYFIAKAEKEGNARFADDLRKAKQGYHDEFQQGVELTEQVYADTFTDEELDDMIVLHSNPALRKARALTSEIFNTILKQYLMVSA
jgi:preprotein translocase subunit SecA